MVKFHINKHGVPATCNSPIDMCMYGDSSTHFPTYELAKEYADKIFESVKGNIVIETTHESQKIRSYYLSATAINEFHKNKKIAELQDFDLIIISWLTMQSVNEGMKLNEVCGVKFTYGDIVRIMESEIKFKTGQLLSLHKYLNPLIGGDWEKQMKVQKELYENTENLTKKLNLDSMTPIFLPMDARKRLQKDGFMRNAENVNEVVYQVLPKISQFGDIICYNHSTEKISKEFDIYEVAGVVEGISLHETCYVSNKKNFEKAWERREDLKGMNYDEALEKYKRKLFFKGVEGLDVPKAIIKMSPIVAKELAAFVERYRAIMGAIGDIIGDTEIPGPLLFEDEDDWIIE